MDQNFKMIDLESVRICHDLKLMQVRPRSVLIEGRNMLEGLVTSALLSGLLGME